ncbi:MAG: hypothetical protein HY913_14030 [Desulfomonile tiedjei]|nr:hypothetical protein [Desulfomonile tiedjei]
MSRDHTESQPILLPDDLMDAVRELSAKLGESPRDIIIAAVDHFTRIPEERRKAVLKGTSLRRRG